MSGKENPRAANIQLNSDMSWATLMSACCFLETSDSWESIRLMWTYCNKVASLTVKPAEGDGLESSTCCVISNYLAQNSGAKDCQFDTWLTRDHTKRPLGHKQSLQRESVVLAPLTTSVRSEFLSWLWQDHIIPDIFSWISFTRCVVVN